MKKDRQEAIRKILNEYPIQTQEELVTALNKAGYHVTQATVSRDMKEMHLIKIPGSETGYQYTVPGSDDIHLSERLTRMLHDSMISVEAAGQMIVVRTLSGSANIAAEALDLLRLPEIAGSIAGDNTIFLVARSNENAVRAAETIRNFMK